MPEKEVSFQQQEPSVKGRNKTLITWKVRIKVDYFWGYLIALFEQQESYNIKYIYDYEWWRGNNFEGGDKGIFLEVKSSGMWCRVAGVVLGVSKDHTVFIQGKNTQD